MKTFKEFFKTTIGMKDSGEIPKTAASDVAAGLGGAPAEVGPTAGAGTKVNAPIPPVVQ